MIQNYYGSLEVFSNYDPRDSVGKRRIETYRKIFRTLEKYIGIKVLDLACGGGITTYVLAELGREVVGVDIQEKMINIAKRALENFKNVEFVISDIKKINLEKTFDSIFFLGNSIIHFSLADFKQVLDVVKKHIDKGGTFFIEYVDGIWDIFKGNAKEKDNIKVAYNQFEGSVDFTVIEKRIRDDLYEGVRVRFYIWTPWILSNLMLEEGFQLIERIYLGDNNYIDVYKLTKKSSCRDEQQN